MTEALNAMIEGMRWQPIESAPRDGTHILVIWDGNPLSVRKVFYSENLGFCLFPDKCQHAVGKIGMSHWRAIPTDKEAEVMRLLLRGVTQSIRHIEYNRRGDIYTELKNALQEANRIAGGAV